MAAYSAVVPLEQLLNQLLDSDLLPKEEVVSLHGKISSLKSSLQMIFPFPGRGILNNLAKRIREIIFEAQDAIESFIFFAQNHPPESPQTSKGQSLTSISLEKIIAEIDPIVKEAKKLGDSMAERRKYTQAVYESPTIKSSSVCLTYNILGQEKYKAAIEKKLTSVTSSLQVIPIAGLPGIGKTTLARSIYEDQNFMKNIPYRAWVTVSQDDKIGDVLSKLLSSLEVRGQKAGDKVFQGDAHKLRRQLHQALSSNKYLVVIDGLWDLDIWAKLKTSLPDHENGSRVLVTTRVSTVAVSVQSSNFILEMEPLNQEDSWTFLRNRTFGDDKECPENVVDIGRNIANHCKGLPLSLTVMDGLLSQASPEPLYWLEIEEDVYMATSIVNVEEAYLAVLSLSYEYLPTRLKGCFLYMAAFPEDSDIPVSKLLRLWVAEGFLTTTPSQLVEKVAEQSLVELIDRNLVTVRKTGSDGRIKYCGINERLRDVAMKESGKDMFFHLRKKHPQKVEQGANAQRRVSVHNNILMCLDDVYNFTKTITKARSLLYFGPHHHHPLPFNLTFDLLRVFDAFTVLFIEFPNEILKLVHLRYLSFTYNGKLPSELSRLQKLQVLIVKRQPNIIYVGEPFLPDEIWYMKELRHLIITETDLPLLSPTEPGSILFENLQTLSNVNATSCTQEVLDNMPNLKRLTMWVEAPGKVGLYLNILHQLEVFKFSVLDPVPGKMVQFGPKLFFPDTVRKLCLSGTGLPWEDMEVIAKLPNLQVLKLKELAFHGDEWCLDYNFQNLKFLLIEYLNLRKWVTDSSRFPRLERLIFRHCYELEELPYIAGVKSLQVVDLVDCTPEAVEWAEATNIRLRGL